jgi:phosphatidylglycerol:prolipoprotein diacylglycerol transferase
MEFPYYLNVGSFRLHPHVLFEALAYAAGFRVYVALRRTQGDVISQSQRWWIIAAAAAGASIGSRMLFLCENPGLTTTHYHDIAYLLSGKTIVGGLLGGLIAVELTKKLIEIRTATGDVFAVPLCIAIAIGRIGCFLTGLSDNTYGTATRLFWASISAMVSAGIQCKSTRSFC